MSHKPGSWAGLLILCLVALTPGSASAQAFDTFEVVCTFHVSDGGPLGRLVQMPDGSLLGTTSAGGLYGGGTIFALKPDGMGGFDFEEIHSFSGPDGRFPFAGLTRAADGYLYGTTAYGGQYDYGTIFRTDASGRITVIHSFPGFDVPEPRYPSGGLLAAGDGYLYGAATGGLAGVGAIFRVSPAGEVSTVHDFDAADGSAPNGDLIESGDGYLYGTTFDGPGTESTIFRVNGAGDFARLHTLTQEEGNWIRGGLVEAGGYFYGTSSYGGANFDGTVFKFTAGGAFTKLHDFGSGGDDGAAPYPGLTLASDGNLYGVTYGGGANGSGVLFRVDGSSGVVTTLHSFDHSVEGANPQGPLMQSATDGMLHGTTYIGGPEIRNFGAVFRSSLGGAVTVLHGFSSNDGYGPVGGLLAASDGSLYGTTRFGGVSGPGTLFRLGASDIPEFLASFASDIEGYHPDATLVESPDGTLLGTAQSGGTGQQGTVFQTTLAGSATTLASFSGPNGSQPSASPVRTGDGNVWGTTTDGGASAHGIIFRIDQSGLTDMHDFDLTGGAGPTSLVSGSDGSLYGIATYGGNLGVLGSAFKIDPSTAAFTVLHLFGSVPDDPSVPSFLAAGSGGALYGTSLNGGSHGHGAVFQLDNAGNVTTLHSFESGVDGFGPGTIMQASTGDLYGTMPDYASHGEVFRLEPGGTLTSMHTFTGGPDGADPTSPLIEAPDGSLYGTTYQGGFSDAGVVYRLLPAAATPTVTSVFPTSGSAAGGASVRLSGTHFQLSPGASFGGLGSPAALGADSRTVIALAPALAPGSISDAAVTNPDATTATLPKAWFADFLDVDSLNLFHDDVEAIVRAGITAGCGGGNYCVNAAVTRAQMAVFLLKAKLGSDHVPPPATGTVFLDVPQGSFAADWIEELASLGITGGCGGGNYCPGSPVTRAQMAVFLLKTSVGSGYVPPVVAEIFDDVAPGAFAADWINDLYGRGITGGCSAAPLLYCPANANTRGQMAVFLTRTFLQP